jgi:hypothetical protein
MLYDQERCERQNHCQTTIKRLAMRYQDEAEAEAADQDNVLQRVYHKHDAPERSSNDDGHRDNKNGSPESL